MLLLGYVNTCAYIAGECSIVTILRTSVCHTPMYCAIAVLNPEFDLIQIPVFKAGQEPLSCLLPVFGDHGTLPAFPKMFVVRNACPVYPCLIYIGKFALFISHP